MQDNKKYRIKEYLDEYRQEHGSNAAQLLEHRILALTQSSKSSFYLRYTACIGEVAKAKTMSIADMLMVMECINEKRTDGDKIKIGDLYHPEVRETELAIYKPVSA